MRTSLFIILSIFGGIIHSSQSNASKTSDDQECFEEQDISWTEYLGKYRDYKKSLESMHFYHLVGIIKIENFQKPTKQNIIHWRMKKNKDKGEIQT
ncbi:MAG: hypothetical protein NTU89_04335 [Candidatus Dependentiae bacterium]|nr:hypothetical protein [Candidatus Dependentiae bacterium]